jgi:hypothetical protein
VLGGATTYIPINVNWPRHPGDLRVVAAVHAGATAQFRRTSGDAR